MIFSNLSLNSGGFRRYKKPIDHNLVSSAWSHKSGGEALPGYADNSCNRIADTI
jgi:hypothetical protein